MRAHKSEINSYRLSIYEYKYHLRSRVMCQNNCIRPPNIKSIVNGMECAAVQRYIIC